MYPPEVRFYITVRNAGNADFTKPYVLVFRNLNPHPYQTNTFGGLCCNQKAETIPVGGHQEIKFYDDYPDDSSSYSFVILTNPAIQREVIEALGHHSNGPTIPPVSREFRYDNNEARITIPGLKEILYGTQHQ
jgi:hypothetical protein